MPTAEYGRSTAGDQHEGDRQQLDRGPVRVAVVGSGVSGLVAAYLLRRAYAVTLFEADDRAGGHAHTHLISESPGNALAVDSGFIVHNDTTYPVLRRLFSELRVATRPAEMSMSILDERSGLQYSGGQGIKGIFAQPFRLADPVFIAMLTQIKRFHRLASRFLEAASDDDATTLGDFLDLHHFGAAVRRHFVIPLVSCVWSTGGVRSLDYPARYLFEFLNNHGMLTVSGSPQWLTVVGGSQQYVSRIVDKIADVRLSTPIVGIERHLDEVVIVDDSGHRESFDKVVIATHPDQALSMLEHPTETERSILGSFRYSTNEAIVHTDTSLLPSAQRARASWNFTVADEPDAHPRVTYWMNRLQGLASDRDYLVSLNCADHIDPKSIISRMNYTHPVYTTEAVAAQRYIDELSCERWVFAGAYRGWGFHEDGARSGVMAAERFGVRW